MIVIKAIVGVHYNVREGPRRTEFI